MRRVARLPRASAKIRESFLSIWIEHKTLPLGVRDRRTMAAALRVLMPAANIGLSMTLYRGAAGVERRCRLYRFSWTSKLDIARKFAVHWQGRDLELQGRILPSTGVVLETVAPPNAILLVREQDGYYDEGEVVVDPFKLSRIKVFERLPALP